MIRRVAFVLAVFCASILVAVSVSAGVSAHLVYVRSPAATGCPDETTLREAVRRRVGYDPFFPSSKTTVVVEITGDGSSFLAHVQLVNERGLSLGVRELRSGKRGCSGLVDAAALAISIALEMNAAETAEPTPVSLSSSEPDPPSDPPPLPAASSAPQDNDPPVDDRDKAHPPIQRQPFQALVGLDALGVLGEAPALVPGFDLWGALRKGIGSLGLEVRGDGPGDIAFSAGGHASLLMVAGTLAPCVHVGAFVACALGSLGWFHASGNQVGNPGAGSALALAFGPRAGVELPIATSLLLRLRGDLLFNAVRPVVRLTGPDWTLPVASAVAGAGLAYQFP